MVSPERRWKRFKVDIRVRIRRLDEPDENSSVVRTYEMSEGGMSVYASETLDVGTLILAEWSLPPEQRPLRIRAVVKNRRGFRCGLQFVDLPETDRAEISHYLFSLADVIEI
jgi:c-di-GMP-binding flagellar brake protein YcgR